MAKNKITLQALSDMMASNGACSKTTSEAFVRNFFSVLKEALQKDNIIKIKGFGTFKLVVVAARESVNVNTGERVSIAEYNKITFTPDKALKERVNKPFAQFDTIPVDDEDIEIIEGTAQEVGEEVPVETPVEKPVENVPVVVEPVVAEEPVAEAPVAKEEEAPVIAPLISEPSPKVAEPIDFEEPEAAPAPEPEPVVEEKAEPVAEPAPEPVAEDKTEEKIETEPEPEPQPAVPEAEETPKKKSRKGCIIVSIILGVILVAALVAGAYYLGSQHVLESPAEVQKPVVKVDTLTKVDTVQAPAPKVDAVADSLAQLREKAANFEQVEGGEYLIVGTKTYRKMKANYTLTRLTVHVYGDKKYLPYVIKYNNIKNPDMVPIGTRLRFPELIEK